MSVTVAKNAGFCFGVSRAVETVEKAAGEGGPVAWSWGLRGTLGSDFIQGAPENQTQA